jgi:hypothetical protein
MMRRLLLLAAVLAALALPAASQVGSLQQWCQAGGQLVSVTGISSAWPVQASYPRCQIEVFLTGTTTPATIYSTSTLTPLANPFCANADGSWLFYAAQSSQYDVTMSNSSACNPTPTYAQLPATFTFFDAGVSGSGGGGSSGTVNPATKGQIGYYATTGSAISGDANITDLNGMVNILEPLGIGSAPPAGCATGQVGCLAFGIGATPCTAAAGTDCVIATASGFNCTIGTAGPFPCLSNGMPVINVKWYGATGAGYPIDDSAAIQAAINACPQVGSYKGCIIFFPAGTYYISVSLTNGPSPYTYHGVHLIGDGTVGRGGGASTILTNGAYYAYIMGNASTANSLGFQAENLAFNDNTGTGLGGFDVIALTDGSLTNITCENYYVGVCITFDGGNGVAQFFHMTNIYTLHTKTRIQTVRRVASFYIDGGEGNCQNSGATDVISGGIDIDLGYSRQVSGAGTVTPSGTSFTIATFTSGLGYLTQDYVGAPMVLPSGTYTIATVTGTGSGTFTTSAGTPGTVSWSISGQGSSGETTINTQAQNCQTGIATFNFGSTHITNKPSEQTIIYRPALSGGVSINGDNPAICNHIDLDDYEITAAGTGAYVGPNCQNVNSRHQVGDGENGVDMVLDATSRQTMRIDAATRFSGWTTNIATISGNGTTATLTTVPNLSTNSGALCAMPGVLILIYGVTGVTAFNGQWATTAGTGISCNDTTGVTTMTFPSTVSGTGSVSSASCNSTGSCVRALSTVLSTSTKAGVLEQTGSQVTTDTTYQQMSSPPQSSYPTSVILGTANVNWDGDFFDVIYGQAGYGVLHQSDGPLVNYAGNNTQYDQPQPTVTNSEITCGTPVNPSSAPNVCQSSDDKGTHFSAAVNGTNFCLPALPDVGFPVGYSVHLIYAPASGNAVWQVIPPGQTSTPYPSAGACPGASGTTLQNTTAQVSILPGGSLWLKVNTAGTGWYYEGGTNTYTPPVPGNSIVLTADVTGIVATGPGTANFMFTLPTPIPPNSKLHFECDGTTTQATGGAGIGIAIGAVANAPTNMEAHAIVATSPTASGYQSSGNITTATETTVYAGSSGTVTTQLPWQIAGSVETGATAPTSVQIGFYTINASDAVTVKRDSSCRWTN